MLVDVLFIYIQMLRQELQFELPEERIAQSPANKRDQSRLLVYNRASGELNHHQFSELPSLLPPNLAIFRNNVSVFKARIPGIRPGGGKVECLLLRQCKLDSLKWRCLLKPGSKTAKTGIFAVEGEYEARVMTSLPSGEYIVKFKLAKDSGLPQLAERIGSLPLPHYIRRPLSKRDDERYQTVYANPDNRTAVAAPTAGLHFTTEITKKLEQLGHCIHDLSLSVGLGTFRPIESEKLEDHSMHTEEYALPPRTKSILRFQNSHRLAVGTTCVRAVEDYLLGPDEDIENFTRGETKLFIRPPYTFLGVDHLLTNFHLPGSTLLCLVSAFLDPQKTDGLRILKELYQEAVSKNYRFYSYGDAMLIL